MTSPESPTDAAAGNAGKTADRARSSHKSPRRRAREYAVQGIYEYLLNADQRVELILAHLRENEHFGKADAPLCDALIRGVLAGRDALDEVHAEIVPGRGVTNSNKPSGVWLMIVGP